MCQVPIDELVELGGLIGIQELKHGHHILHLLLDGIPLKNVLPLVQNDNYSEPKLVCRQLLYNVYKVSKVCTPFSSFCPSKYQNNHLGTLFLFKSHPENCLCDFPHCLDTYCQDHAWELTIIG